MHRAFLLEKSNSQLSALSSQLSALSSQLSALSSQLSALSYLTQSHSVLHHFHRDLWIALRALGLQDADVDPEAYPRV